MIDPAIAIDDHLDKSISHKNVIERVITKAIISKIAPTKPIKSNFFFILVIFLVSKLQPAAESNR